MSFSGVSMPHAHGNAHHHGCKILSRQEAKQKLRELVPGTPEHSQLQDALARIDGIVEISLPNLTYKVHTVPEDQKLLGGFGSCEHVAIGAAATLFKQENGKTVVMDEPVLIVGSTAINFKYIVALAGDFYAIYGQAISLLGGTDVEKKARFENAFNTLYKGDPKQIRGVMEEIDGECRAVAASPLPHQCYCYQMTDKDRAIRGIKPDTQKLLYDNSDHFYENAVDAYKVGHRWALEVAAGAKGDKEELKRAYAIDAFALHFLTDLFASGHVRNQRGALELFLNTLKFDSIPFFQVTLPLKKELAGILTGAQHEKDGNEGLNVRNKRGDFWRAYGDGCFFQDRNEENRKMAIEATQASVREVFEAFLSGSIPATNPVYDLLPYATDLNPKPLYEIKGNRLTLYRGSQGIPITKAEEYLREGISLALLHLPANYVDGFIDGFGEGFRKWLSLPKTNPAAKAILRQLSRGLGVIWKTIGLPTHTQVSQEFQKVNDKFDEMALVLRAACDAIAKIDKRLKSIESTLHLQGLYQDIRGPITDINSIVFQHKLYDSSTFDPLQIERDEGTVLKAHSVLGSVFTNGTAEGRNILALYSDYLEQSTKMQPFERKIEVTLWYRQMLDYQIKAFHLYAVFRMMGTRGREESVQNERKLKLTDQTQRFETSILNQIKANKEYIVASLIHRKTSDIQKVLQKYRDGHTSPIFDILMTGTFESAPSVLASRLQFSQGVIRGPLREHFSDRKVVKKWLNRLFKQTEMAPVLEFAKWAILGFPIGFPGRSDAKLAICVDGQKGSGVKGDVIHLEVSDGVKPNAFFGIAMRELTRFVAREVFANSGRPYFETDQSQKRFQEIRGRTEKVHESLDTLIKNVFQTGNFKKWEWDQELFVRVPEMLITYRDTSLAEGGTGVERLESNEATKELLSYFRYHFLYFVSAHMKTVLDKAKEPFPQISQ